MLKFIGRLIGALVRLAVVAGVVIVVLRGLRQFQGDPEGVGDEGFAFSDGDDDPYQVDESELGGEVSDELLELLACPVDRGPLELADDGRWLLNPRNGNRYPIQDGIPIMLTEVGERYRDTSMIRDAEAAGAAGENGAA